MPSHPFPPTAPPSQSRAGNNTWPELNGLTLLDRLSRNGEGLEFPPCVISFPLIARKITLLQSLELTKGENKKKIHLHSFQKGWVTQFDSEGADLSPM